MGVLTAAPSGDLAVPDDGWSNEESVRGGLQLIYDSQGTAEEGEDSWDVAAHPRVYFTSESHQSNNPNLAEDANFAGYHVIDAYTKAFFERLWSMRHVYNLNRVKLGVVIVNGLYPNSNRQKRRSILLPLFKPLYRSRIAIDQVACRTI